MREIIVATGNKNKMTEMREILEDSNVKLKSLKDIGLGNIEINENGRTFEENALIKARTVHEITKGIVIADDSGLVVDALDGAPGIYSARYMGHETSYHIKNTHIIKELEGVPDEKRTARFVCAMACVMEDGGEFTVTRNFEGRIGYEEKGENGFGYDPIFYLPEYGCMSSELSPEEKNGISHRGKALRAMYEELFRRGVFNE
ncbi:MAG: RdgB/HAM1 family non-canonical purine NTP pyrophosphatase [Lachnospiraceae bacterium]|jgi:XTP/dITP diphosphohydrolase|nr:RdgB/HAM1 family non-canonical purine NTP pyrophosphatase [Lachnospiraceae bacterium]MEE3460635.1 RdgB/HAM1 family non-canonical purine NTP pyrophosphatase [Lachnospiraceae bacterium]